jgi:hypothetical protein
MDLCGFSGHRLTFEGRFYMIAGYRLPECHPFVSIQTKVSGHASKDFYQG